MTTTPDALASIHAALERVEQFSGQTKDFWYSYFHRQIGRWCADSQCHTCEGRGGTLSYDIQGEDAWATTITYLDECPDCLGQDKCPGCGAQYVTCERIQFTCDLCSWCYDEDRFAPDEDYDTEGY